MDCREAQSLVNAYIDKSLTMEQLEKLLNHVEKCPDCYEELETYFTVYYAMKRLDDDKGTFNVNKLLHEDMQRRRRRVRGYKIRQAVLMVLIVLAGTMVIFEVLRFLGIVLL